jgi:PAS domain-containing protein
MVSAMSGDDKNGTEGTGEKATNGGHPLARAIVDTVRDALIVLDRDLRVVAASRSFYQTFGASPKFRMRYKHS